jgi:hypothetical protein
MQTMTDQFSLPPIRDLPPGRLAQRAERLHAEITAQRRLRLLPQFASPSRWSAHPRLAAFGGATALIVLAVPALAFSGVLGSLLGLSNPGVPVSTAGVDLSDAQILEEDHVDVGGGVTLLATRGSTSFYVSRTTDGRTCLLTGAAGGTAPRRITINTPCESGFPSPSRPILGFYLLARASGSPVQTIAALQGLAADGVATVDAVDGAGDVLLSAPVSDNVYSARLADSQDVADARSVVKIEARDSKGDVVYSEDIPQPAWRTGQP